MTHVLDEAIEDLRWSIAEDMERRHRHGRHTRLTMHRVVRSHIALLRLAYAEREGGRAAELRAEGRREERERITAWLEKRSSEAPAPPPYTGGEDEYMILDTLVTLIEDGDHWRGGEG